MSQNSNLRQRIFRWLPFAACVLFGAIAAIFHPVVMGEAKPLVYLQLSAAVVPLVIIVAERIFRIRVPYFMHVIVALQIILAIDFGTALNAYVFIPYYDKFLHTFFGVWCAVFMYYFILRWSGQALNKWGMYALVLLSVLGFAALWEIFEYYTDLIFGNNAQGWKGMAEGQNPLTDTMLDIVVAAVGAFIFFVTLFADRRTGGRLYGSFAQQGAAAGGKGETADGGSMPEGSTASAGVPEEGEDADFSAGRNAAEAAPEEGASGEESAPDELGGARHNGRT